MPARIAMIAIGLAPWSCVCFSTKLGSPGRVKLRKTSLQNGYQEMKLSVSCRSAGAPLLRVCVKAEDIPIAEEAAQRAADRGLTLVHQCHTLSLFETLGGIVQALEGIDRPGFGLIFEATTQTAT